MSKVYQALEHARVDRLQVNTQSDAPAVLKELSVVRSSPTTPDVQMKKEMLVLFQSLASSQVHPESKILQFIGSREGEGTSTIVREFAKVLTEQKSKSVLLIDADSQELTQCRKFGIKPKSSLDRVINGGVDLKDAISQIELTQLFVTSYFANVGYKVSCTLEAQNYDVWEELRKQFDWILVDSPPYSVSVDGLAFCDKVDGVVLVVEAEKSRIPVVDNARERIIKCGGNCLGIVFNKQRYHIPNWLYKRL